jgi:micrococcal nuclease
VKELLALAGTHKVLSAVVVAGVVAAGGVAVAAADRSTTATVTKVVDGDTIDVRYNGDEHRVRLLNIDTPESVDPNSSVECLGPEASAWLDRRLPVGTEVRLEHDRETRDKYDRELAAVFLGDEFVNAEIARAGLGIAMSVGSNVKYLSQVKAAQSEAENAGRGLFASSNECTIPAQVEQLTTVAEDTIAQNPASTAELADFDAHAAELAAVVATGKALLALLDGDVDELPLVAYRGQVSNLRYQVTMVKERLESAKTRNGAAREARQDRLDEEARLAAEEAARLAAEEAARQAAAEAARQAEAERAAAARATQRSRTTYRPPAPSTATRTEAPPPPNGGSGSSTYTGCRSYAPGGKTWTPIPC